MKVHWFNDEIIEVPFGIVVLGICALVASAILWG